MTSVRTIGDEELLTQAGQTYRSGGYEFRHALRGGELDISLLAGNLPPSIACAIRAFGQRRRNDSRDAARVVSAARLRQLGFRIEHTPRDLIPDHVSAYWDDGPWDAKVAELFCRAFRAPVSQTEGAA